MNSGLTWRFRIVVCALLIVAFALVFRVIKLAVLDKAFLQGQGNARSIRVVDIPAFRGVITDRHNNILALSTPVFAIWVSPRKISLTPDVVKSLANALSMSEDNLKQKVTKAKGRGFVYLKRGVSPNVKANVDKLQLPGVYARQEFKRFYPHGEVTSHVLGFTNIDDSGIEGVELAYNRWLSGVKGREKVIKDRLGQVIDKVNIIKPPKTGRQLTLSIDKRIQYYVYQALVDTCKRFKAKSGSVVVLDSRTGEVLAMANIPSFNPNQPIIERDGSYRNRAVTDVFEPGSVMKAFSIASALDSHAFTTESLIDTTPSWMVVDGNLIRDDRANGQLTLTQILQRSSNVGVTKLVLASPAMQLVTMLRRFGFGQTTGSGFPGESSGEVRDRRQSRLFDLATLGFGYGMTATTLQLAHGYSVFANHGLLVPVSLLKQEGSIHARRTLDKTVANHLLSMLEAVVEDDGTGRRARIKGYRVAGKTGTSRLVGKKGYEKNRHIATFVGIAPVSSPRLVVAVMIREPRAISYYGGAVAAPLFADIMEGSLTLLGVKPDKVSGA